MPSPKKITTVFFDAGNTLFRETPLRWEIYAQAGREHGLTIDTEEMKRSMFRTHEELPQRVRGQFRYSDAWFSEYIPRVFSRFGAKPDQIPAISERLFASFRSPGTFQLFPETVEVLEELTRMQIRMAIISNWSPRLPRVCTHLGLDKYFKFILSSAIEEMEKPEPAIFNRALSMIDSKPEESLHVGDSLEKDVQGAAGVGILGVLIDRSERQALSGVTAISSLKELPKMIERLK